MKQHYTLRPVIAYYKYPAAIVQRWQIVDNCGRAVSVGNSHLKQSIVCNNLNNRINK
jgi:hypothetical protein